ncbi:nitrogen regulatory protein PII [Enterococcus sp. PF1-24]|uniref:P-II family nitrogen regulator n=1 Tax=unclassified Enterococcus TaxID=2608891 RepID=UPI0024734E63|nr:MULTISPECIES: P-II family nitrogen regulator [unclassified Enterococcus]MDH6364140.1 nitrogen regulatory protein PII [Enterococcus sp. PFB1-1]MDH6401241.1 nitrogen regulatory protein PII [Enterococcus sp. PF1-24]
MKSPVALNLDLIVTIVDGGNGHDVIHFAKEVGATGGTILHGRGAGIHDTGKFLGLEIEPEKDVVLVLVPSSLTNVVLSSIGEGIEISKPGNGIIFTIDVSKVMGISKIQDYCQVVDLEDLLENDK